MEQISLQMHTLRDFLKTPQDALETFQRVAQIGYRVVQPSIPPFWTADALREALERFGLRADSFPHLKLGMAGELDAILRTADVLGARVVRAGAIPLAQSYARDDFLRYAEAAERDAALLHAHGIAYLYHFHAWEYVDLGGETGIDLMLRETEHIRFQPDVHWMAAAGVEPSAGLAAFAGRAPYIHMQGYAILPDPEGKCATNRCTVPVGQGNLNWRGIVRSAREIGVENYVVEQDDCYIDAFESVRQSREALELLLKV